MWERKNVKSFLPLYLNYSYDCTCFESDSSPGFDESYLTMYWLQVFNRHLTPVLSINSSSTWADLPHTHNTQHTTIQNNTQQYTYWKTSKVDWYVRVGDIVGIVIGDCGHSCKEHTICGCVVNPDILVRFIKEEIMVDGKIKVVISIAWVTASIEHCYVVFLPQFLVPLLNSLNGILMQVTEVFDKSHSSAIIRR